MGRHSFAGDRETWISSARGIADLNSMSIPNVALTVPEDLLAHYISHFLTVEKPELILTTKPSEITLGQQVISINTVYRIELDRQLTGLPFDVLVHGSVIFGVSFTFNGKFIRFLPFVKEVVIDSIQGPAGPVTVDISEKIPDWINRIVQEYLDSQGYLRLPVELTATFPLSVDAIYGGGRANGVSLSINKLTGEFWINSASVLVRPGGVFAIAEAQFGLSWPACNMLEPIILEGQFLRYADRKPIQVLEPLSEAVIFSGEVNQKRGDYTAYWRLNGITISRHSLSVTPRIDVAFATIPGGYGTYSMMVVASVAEGEDGTRTECLVAQKEITKPYDPPNIPEPVTPIEATNKFEEFKALFEEKRTTGGLPADAVLLGSVRKDLLASALSQTITGLGLRAAIDASAFPRVSFNGIDVERPPLESLSCTPTRDCRPTRQCDLKHCPFDEDRRDCSRDSWFGSYNDPFCEAAKAAENVRRRAHQKLCEAEAALEKLDCERLKAQEKATCELEKAAEKALCESMKEAIGLLSPDENIASVDLDFEFTGAAVAALLSLQIDNSLSSFDVAAEFGAALRTRASIKFTPKNLAGHLACFSQWKESVLLGAFVPNQLFEISGTINLDAASKTVRIRVTTPAATVDFSPRPFTALFAQHPHLIAVCPLIFAAGVAEGIYKSLKGNYDATLVAGKYEVEETDVEFEITLPGLVIPSYFNMPALTLELFDDPATISWR